MPRRRKKWNKRKRQKAMKQSISLLIISVICCSMAYMWARDTYSGMLQYRYDVNKAFTIADGNLAFVQANTLNITNTLEIIDPTIYEGQLETEMGSLNVGGSSGLGNFTLFEGTNSSNFDKDAWGSQNTHKVIDASNYHTYSYSNFGGKNFLKSTFQTSTVVIPGGYCFKYTPTYPITVNDDMKLSIKFKSASNDTTTFKFIARNASDNHYSAYFDTEEWSIIEVDLTHADTINNIYAYYDAATEVDLWIEWIKLTNCDISEYYGEINSELFDQYAEVPSSSQMRFNQFKFYEYPEISLSLNASMFISGNNPTPELEFETYPNGIKYKFFLDLKDFQNDASSYTLEEIRFYKKIDGNYSNVEINGLQIWEEDVDYTATLTQDADDEYICYYVLDFDLPSSYENMQNQRSMGFLQYREGCYSIDVWCESSGTLEMIAGAIGGIGSIFQEIYETQSIVLIGQLALVVVIIMSIISPRVRYRTTYTIKSVLYKLGIGKKPYLKK